MIKNLLTKYKYGRDVICLSSFININMYLVCYGRGKYILSPPYGFSRKRSIFHPGLHYPRLIAGWAETNKKIKPSLKFLEISELDGMNGRDVIIKKNLNSRKFLNTQYSLILVNVMERMSNWSLVLAMLAKYSNKLY